MARRKKRSVIGTFFGIVGILLLAALVAAAVAAGLFYRSMRSVPAVTDDIHSIRQSESMPVSERFRFHADDRTAEIRLDKDDLWRLLLNSGFEKDIDGLIRRADSLGMTVHGYGIEALENSFALNIDLQYSVFRSAVRIPLSVSFRKNGFVISPTAVKLGDYTLPDSLFVERFGFSLRSYEIRWEDGWYFITDIRDSSYADGVFTIRGSFNTDILSGLDIPYRQNDIPMSRYSDFFQMTLRALEERQSGQGDGFSEWMPLLESDPSRIRALLEEMFSISYDRGCLKRNYSVFQSFGFADLFSPDPFSSVHAQFLSQLSFRENMQNLLLRELASLYGSSSLLFRNGVLTYKSSPFDPAAWAEELFGSEETGWLTGNGFRLVFVDSPRAYSEDSPRLRNILSGSAEFSSPVVEKERYPLGFIARGMDGTPFLMYRAADISYSGGQTVSPKLLELGEREYLSLYESDPFPVYTDDSAFSS